MFATAAQASSSHKPYCSSMNFLPGPEALEQQRNYRTGYRDPMLQCGRVGMADEFERDPRLVSLHIRGRAGVGVGFLSAGRSEEHTSELQSLMRTSYAVFCLKKKTHPTTETP